MVLMLAGAACIAAASTPADDDAPFAPIPDQNLHNVHRVTDKVISGSQPDNDAALETLAALGVKTIISVDGARPDAHAAAAHGMRYVHLPIGYDGVADDEAKALAKAMAELPGPIYVHCHHGHHRVAAAVAVGCVLNGSLPPDRGVDVLTTLGTGEKYKGLWRAARDARPLDPKVLAELRVKFVPAAEIGPLADAMVHIDQRWEHLKAIRAAGWTSPTDHPDLDPAHEALLLQELFRELARPGPRNESVKNHPAPFHRMLHESETAAATLQTALATIPVNRDQAAAAFDAIAKTCKSCHQSHRD